MAAYKDISGLTVEELRRKSKELNTELFESKMKNALGQLASPITIRGLRRDIARVKTALAQKLSR